MLEKMEKIINNQMLDAVKFDHGVNEPGRRVRAGMQQVRLLAKDIRDEIQSKKKARKAKKDVE
jgi:hypothetical protein